MPVSPNFDIPYPDGTSGFTPLQQHFAAIANGVDTALMTGLGGAPRVAYSDAERATVFPSPVQGNLIVRPDKGWIEQYYDLYNSATNPAGAIVAGWYPMPNSGPMCFVKKNIGQNTVNGNATVLWNSTGAELDTGGMYNPVLTTGVTIPITGWYNIRSKVSQSGTTPWTTSVYVNDVLDATTPVGNFGMAGAATRPYIDVPLPLNAGDIVAIVLGATTAGTAVGAGTSWLNVEWARVRQH